MRHRAYVNARPMPVAIPLNGVKATTAAARVISLLRTTRCDSVCRYG